MSASQPPFVLIVEDSGSLASLLANMLRRWGMQSLLVASMAALRRRLDASPRRPDAVIADYELAGPETGVDIALELVERFTPPPPIILLSGNCAQATQDVAALGARRDNLFFEVIEKGEDARSVFALIGAAIERAIAAPNSR